MDEKAEKDEKTMGEPEHAIQDSLGAMDEQAEDEKTMGEPEHAMDEQEHANPDVWPVPSLACIHANSEILSYQVEEIKKFCNYRKYFKSKISRVITIFVLTKFFENCVNYTFTTRVEESLDQIAKDKLSENSLLNFFFNF